jgi:predicted nucleotidyltransferase component of viral defense system
MKELYQLTADERKPFFESAAYEGKKPLAIIEKDYWVVWTLARLFELPDLKAHLTFKGGTSLSKIYSLIERFSEDIDVSIEREFLGFGDDKAPEKLATKSKQQTLLSEISAACAKYIQGKMQPELEASIAAKLGGKHGWTLSVDPDDGQTLLFAYPSLAPKDEYVRPIVKIEMGARAEHWPVSDHPVQSYAKEILGDKIVESKTIVRVLNAERTFWEKATILHQYAHLPDGRELPARLSRHWYDFFRLLNSEVKAAALKDADLLERVANHKKVYFASGWANYDQARKGSLRLLPQTRVHDALEKDYGLMGSMLFGESPAWTAIIESISAFEKEFNA